MLPRRTFLVAAAAMFAAPARAGAQSLAAIEKALGGRLGAFAVNVAAGAALSHHAGERFALCSTFKLALAARVLQRAERGEDSLEETIAFSKDDLLFHSPVTAQHAEEGAMSVGALAAAIVEHSDNLGANLLLARVGGPQGMTAFFRALGDGTTRLDRYELELNSNIPGDERDTTTPEAMAGTLRALLVDGAALSPASRETLIGWMRRERNAPGRLRAGLPADWRAGSKPGTSNNGATNDIGIAFPPGTGPLVISVYVDAPDAQPTARVAAIAAAARFFAERLS
ncbi:MAG: class A beta-lactamase [Pseudomonadota bacterium]|nr:class A beta-lactamase [Pseudomonadota bacterium]